MCLINCSDFSVRVGVCRVCLVCLFVYVRGARRRGVFVIGFISLTVATGGRGACRVDEGGRIESLTLLLQGVRCACVRARRKRLVLKRRRKQKQIELIDRPNERVYGLCPSATSPFLSLCYCLLVFPMHFEGTTTQ